MNNRKTHNSALILATLGVYLGLVLVGATPQILAQDKPATEIVVNKLPLNDFAQSVGTLIRNKKIDLSQSFSVTLDGYLTESGTLDPKRSKFVESKGNLQLVDAAKQGLEAIGDSGFFGYLRQLGIEKVKVTISQDGQMVSANLSADANVKQRAQTIASGLGMAIQIGKEQVQNNYDKILLKSVNLTSSGSILNISMIVPSEQVQEIILDRTYRTEND